MDPQKLLYRMSHGTVDKMDFRQMNVDHVYDAEEHKTSGDFGYNYDDDGILSETHTGQDVDFDDPEITSLPRILLMGPRRSGKTSVQRVVFHKMSPHETLFRLEATQRLERAVVENTRLCRFTLWDFPGDYYGISREENHDHIFLGSTSVVFVMDAQDEPYDHVLQSFTNAVTRAVQVNPSVTIEVFINKVDGELFLSDESKYDCRRDIMTQVTDELTEAGVSPEMIHIRYHLTSIYDHSIFDALSLVVQRLIPQLPTLENLLNVLVSTCSMEKAYLFDVASKLYISTDSSPVDMQSVELCSDMIDVVLDVSGIYGLGPPNNKTRELENDKPNQSGSNEFSTDEVENTGVSNRLTQSHDEGNDTIKRQASTGEEVVTETTDSAYDNESSSVIRLSNGVVLYLKEVETMLALVCITRSENFRKKSLIDYNIGCIRKALSTLMQVET